MAVQGAYGFSMLNAPLLLECLIAYKALHGISPSPRVLVRIARSASGMHGDAAMGKKGEEEGNGDDDEEEQEDDSEDEHKQEDERGKEEQEEDDGELRH